MKYPLVIMLLIVSKHEANISVLSRNPNPIISLGKISETCQVFDGTLLWKPRLMQQIITWTIRKGIPSYGQQYYHNLSTDTNKCTIS